MPKESYRRNQAYWNTRLKNEGLSVIQKKDERFISFNFGTSGNKRTPGQPFAARDEGTCAACGGRFGVLVQVIKRHGDHQLVHRDCPVEASSTNRDFESECFPGTFTIGRRHSS